MVISSWSYKELQRFCKDHGLVAIGKTEELRDRVNRYFCKGSVVDVVFDDDDPRQPHKIRRGVITQMLLNEGQYGEFDVQYEDNGEIFNHGIRAGAKTRHFAFVSRPPTDDEKRSAIFPSLGGDDKATPKQKETKVVDNNGVDYLAHHLGAMQLRHPRKRALIIGCSYSGQSCSLQGTINDAHAIYKLLVGYFNFPDDSENIKYLTDDHSDRFLLPTRCNILKGFKWLMKDLQSGDALFFYFAGHGDSQADPTGREPRGNQVIFPCDFLTQGVITDTEIHEHLVMPLPDKVTLHALVDSCHSGTVMNLPYNAVFHQCRFTRWTEEYPGQSHKYGTNRGVAYQISAAQHNQYAAEGPMEGGRASSSGVHQGAATHGFIHAIKLHQKHWGAHVTYGELIESMYEVLHKSRFWDQDPQLSASMQLDLNRPEVRFEL